MTAIQEIALSKLMPSKANVRRTGQTDRVEELAASIQAHGLLQNITVRPTTKGRFEVVAGGRRFAALKLLAKRKAWDAPVPCQVMEGENVTEVSLAENAMQEPMHPADQFEAFAKLQGEGMGVEDIAARFGVTPHVVQQRLKLGAVSPKLMALYREGDLNLDQLSAFAITDDHDLQERVWADIGFDTSRRAILEALGEGQVSTGERRVVLVGLDTYSEAGGTVLRDLFDEEGGGFVTDVALLNRLVRERLDALAETIKAEGWKWVRVEAEFDYALASGMRRIYPEPKELSEAEQQRVEELTARYNALCDEEDGSDAIEQELAAIDSELDRLQDEEVYQPEQIALAGAFVSIGRQGEVRVERGFINAEDDKGSDDERESVAGVPLPKAKPELPASLVVEMTTHRTAALANELAQNSALALKALLHRLVLNLFYVDRRHSCLDIAARRTPMSQVADIETSIAGRAIAERHDRWVKRLPEEPEDVWQFVGDLADGVFGDLIAHCVSLTVNAVRSGAIGDEQSLSHADALASGVSLDTAAYWRPTVAGYFGRVPKPKILAAVREAVSPEAAQTCEAMKKPEMAARAEKLVGPTDWLPEVLR